MSRARQDRVLSLLVRREGWVTAAELADSLGVTPRSVRNYVAALNDRVPEGSVVLSGPHGYRADVDAATAQRQATETGTPRERLRRVIRALLNDPDGIDIYRTADELYISVATLESDLARARAQLGGSELAIERAADRARLRGSEAAQRRLLSQLVHEESVDGAFDLDALSRAVGAAAVGTDALAAFKADLVSGLGDLGFFVNEFGLGDVMLHIAIAADRVARSRGLDHTAGDDMGSLAPVGALIDTLSARHFGVTLGAGERHQLAALVQSRVVAPDAEQPASVIRRRLDPEVEATVAAVVRRAAEDFLVDIDHEDFVLRLALHVQNLRDRVRSQLQSRNPLTRSLKASYPMIFEIAVFIADGLQDMLGMPVADDELAYIAMHVGGRLERSRRAASLLTATIVCPGYYELHDLLRSSIDRSLGQQIDVVGVETRVDPDWTAIDTDLILTTLEAPLASDRVVRIQPFLTESDVERVRAAAGRLRRGRRLATLRTELERYFSASAFVRPLDAEGGEEAVIRSLGGMLVAQGVVDEDYVERAIAREHLSSTAFTDALAVPHALGLTASRTAIALGIADASIPWGDARVQVVALVAFSESDRAAFQTVFEQLVEVFTERESVQRLLRRGTTFTGFLDELVAVIDG